MNAPVELQAQDAAAARRRSTLTLIGAFWLFAFAVLSVRAAFIDTLPFNVMAPRRLLTAAFGAAMCLAMAYALGRLRYRSFPERVALGLVGAFALSVLLTIFTLIMNRVVIPLPVLSPFHPIETIQWVMVWFGYFLAWTGTHLALTYHWEAEEQARQAVVMRELTQEARIAALRYQLNPHFLFNTLNSISSLVLERRNREAETMLLNLSAFIRSTIAADPRGTIALGEEIELQRRYLEIEEARFSERMQVEVDVPEALARASVPALILQPLVENAVRHGVDRSEAMTTIRIAADSDGARLRLLVEDDGGGEGAPQSGTGLGLNNVRERLHAHFGEQGRLQAQARPQGGFRAEVELPLAVRP